MKNIKLILVMLITSQMLHAQEIEINLEGSSELFIEQLNQSKELKFAEILERYQSYISNNPEDLIAKLEKCKLLSNAFYDEYEDYNPYHEESEDCITKLVIEYPESPEVLLYQIKNTWGSDLEKLLNKSLGLMESNKQNWSYNQRSQLYEALSYYYAIDNDFLSIRYAEQAVRYSDSLDMSVELSEAYSRLGNSEKAKEVLMDQLYMNAEYAWTYKQKGDLLLQFNEYEEASIMYNRAKTMDSTVIDNYSIYNITLEEAPESARVYLVKDTVNEWNKISTIQRLLNHDLQYSDAETSFKVYEIIQELSYYDDFFGFKRIRLFFKNPTRFFSWTDITHFIWLAVFILGLFIMPYLWILPIYSFNKIFKIKISTSYLKFNWSLKHFWLISFLYLFLQVFVLLIFFYQDVTNYYFDVTFYDELSLFGEGDSILTAQLNMVYFILMLLITLCFINRNRLKIIFNSIWSWGRIIFFSFGFLCLCALVNQLSQGIFGTEDFSAYLNLFNGKIEARAILSEYGFMIAFIIIALLVPFYEEVIFRGIILSSVQKHTGFILANVIQAFLFGLIHFNLSLLVFYTIFGFILGLVAKRSQGLLTSIVFHGVNNFVVIAAMTISNV